MNRHKISVISDDVLARIFFKRLWQSYDSGGFSVGRSIQSNLLESYLHLNQYDNLPEFPLGLREFAEEADRRCSFIYRQTVFGDLENLSTISNHDISLLCIDALRTWYHTYKDVKTPQGYLANTWESRFVDSVYKIMPIPNFVKFESNEDFVKIWKEADDRIRILYANDSFFT